MFYVRIVLPCVYFKLLDPEILSAASSFLRPLNIACGGFDQIFLRVCTLLRPTYARIRAYQVLLTVRPILRSFDVTLDKNA